MRALRWTRGAPRSLGALFVVGCWLLATPVSAESCATDRNDDRARVRWVIDGDTVELATGRRVRLIGMNAPEVTHKDRPGEPYGTSATRALRRLLAEHDEQVILHVGREPEDRYGRLLAHVFLPDGVSVTATLLREGLGTVLVVPPNTWNIECYWSAEEAARGARRGIWSLPQYQVIETTQLDEGAQGYRLIEGRVVRVGRGGGAVWINLEGGVALRITLDDLRYFPGTDFGYWMGRQVLARGWVYQRCGQSRMRIRHPAVLRLLDERS